MFASLASGLWDRACPETRPSSLSPRGRTKPLKARPALPRARGRPQANRSDHRLVVRCLPPRTEQAECRHPSRPAPFGGPRTGESAPLLRERGRLPRRLRPHCPAGQHGGAGAPGFPRFQRRLRVLLHPGCGQSHSPPGGSVPESEFRPFSQSRRCFCQHVSPCHCPPWEAVGTTSGAGGRAQTCVWCRLQGT